MKYTNNDELLCVVGGPIAVVGRLQDKVDEETKRADENYAAYERIKQKYEKAAAREVALVHALRPFLRLQYPTTSEEGGWHDARVAVKRAREVLGNDALMLPAPLPPRGFRACEKCQRIAWPGDAFAHAPGCADDAATATAIGVRGDVFALMRDHYLAGIDCNEENHTDTAACSCALMMAAAQPSIGQAVQQWIDHVRDVVEGRWTQEGALKAMRSYREPDKNIDSPISPADAGKAGAK